MRELRLRLPGSRNDQSSRRRRSCLALTTFLWLGFLAACTAAAPTRHMDMTPQPGLGGGTVVPRNTKGVSRPPTLTPTTTPTATPIPPLAARVNGQLILLADFERQMAQYQQALEDQGLDPKSPAGQAELAQIRRDVLEGMIDAALMEQAATSLGIEVSDEELQTRIRSDIVAGGGQTEFEEWLRSTGQTLQEYEDLVRQSMLSERVVEAVTKGIPAKLEQVHIRHMVLDTEESAQQVLAELLEGADFAVLAAERSLDSATREQGGDLGWVPRGLMAPELESAAFSLQPGQVSGVIQVGEGYHILQVLERDEARVLEPEARLQLRLALFEEWLEAQRAAAEIERFVGD